jgi:hypothetical protein
MGEWFDDPVSAASASVYRKKIRRQRIVHAAIAAHGTDALGVAASLIYYGSNDTEQVGALRALIDAIEGNDDD